MPRVALGTYTTSRLLQIIEGRKKQLPSLQRKRALLQKQIDSLNERISELGDVESAAPATRSGRARNSRSLPDTLFKVLSKHGALGIGEIVKKVKATGYKSSSPQFRAIVNQALIKDNRFSKASRGVYEVKK
jgi:hypothetical protein